MNFIIPQNREILIFLFIYVGVALDLYKLRAFVIFRKNCQHISPSLYFNPILDTVWLEWPCTDLENYVWLQIQFLI